MKSTFEITDEKIISDLLQRTEYATLALSDSGKPYSVPVNFAMSGDVIYFHGSKTGRKMEIIKNNPQVSLSIVENFSVIQSYFSSDEELACPASQFFKSIIIDGTVEIVEDGTEKREALTAIMQKLQPEGKYKPFNDAAYDKMIDATTILKVNEQERRAKFKFGQHLSEERFDKIVRHLEDRGSDVDKATIETMKQFRKG